MLWWNLRKLRRGASRQRSDAVTQLSQSKSPRTLDALIRILQTPGEYSTSKPGNLRFRGESAEAREAAAEVLGNLKNARAVEPLIAALKNDKAEEVRSRAASVLSRFGGARVQQALEEKLRAGDEDRSVVHNVAEILARMGEAAKPALAAAMRDERDAIRREVALTLYWVQDARFSDLLVNALQDGDEEVRRYAGKALLELAKKGAATGGPPTPLMLLLAAVEPSKDVSEGALDLRQIRGRVQEILGKIPAEWWKTLEARYAVPTLIEKTRDDSYKVRVAAVEALGRIGDPSARKALLEFLFGEVNARRAGSMAVAGGYAAAKEALDAIAPDWRQSEDGRRGVYELINKLVNHDPGTRGQGSHSLPEIDPQWEKSEEAKRALPALMLGLRYPDKYQRSNAAFYLGEIGDPQAVDWLLDAFDDAEDEVRQSVRGALETSCRRRRSPNGSKLGEPSRPAWRRRKTKQRQAARCGRRWNPAGMCRRARSI